MTPTETLEKLLEESGAHMVLPNETVRKAFAALEADVSRLRADRERLEEMAKNGWAVRRPPHHRIVSGLESGHRRREKGGRVSTRAKFMALMTVRDESELVTIPQLGRLFAKHCSEWESFPVQRWIRRFSEAA